jgi:hypothetical protein
MVHLLKMSVAVAAKAQPISVALADNTENNPKLQVLTAAMR